MSGLWDKLILFVTWVGYYYFEFWCDMFWLCLFVQGTINMAPGDLWEDMVRTLNDSPKWNPTILESRVRISGESSVVFISLIYYHNVLISFLNNRIQTAPYNVELFFSLWILVIMKIKHFRVAEKMLNNLYSPQAF